MQFVGLPARKDKTYILLNSTTAASKQGTSIHIPVIIYIDTFTHHKPSGFCFCFLLITSYFPVFNNLPKQPLRHTYCMFLLAR